MWGFTPGRLCARWLRCCVTRAELSRDEQAQNPALQSGEDVDGRVLALSLVCAMAIGCRPKGCGWRVRDSLPGSEWRVTATGRNDAQCRCKREKRLVPASVRGGGTDKKAMVGARLAGGHVWVAGTLGLSTATVVPAIGCAWLRQRSQPAVPQRRKPLATRLDDCRIDRRQDQCRIIRG